MKLKVKLPLLLLPLVAIPLLIVGIVAHVQLRDVAEDSSITQTETLLEQISIQVENLVDNATSNLHLFSEYPLLKQYFSADSEDERYLVLYRPVQRQLLTIQKAYPKYSELRIILPDGFEDVRLVNRDIPNLTEEEQNSPFFVELKDSPSEVVVRFDRNPDTDELVCFVSKRITLINEATDDPAAEPRLRGYLSITLDISGLISQLDTNPLGGKSGLFLTDEAGRMMHLPEQLKWLAPENLPLSGLRSKQHEIVEQQVSLAGGNFQLRSHKLQNNIWLHAVQSEHDLFASSRSITKIVGIITFVVILISLSLIFYILRVQVLVPVTRLRKAIIRLSAGNDLIQIPVESNDELGELGTEFNRMGFELKRSNDQIRNMAYSDHLTELPNRFMFHKTLRQSMDAALRDDKQLGLLFIDLDNFKNINDTLGHHIGDILLKEVALRLQQNLRGKDMTGRFDLEELEHNLARLGGDEFTVLLSGTKSVINIGKVAERLIESIEVPFQLDGKEHHISASVGIAVYPGDGNNTEDLIKHADLAMYQAKKKGKGCFEFYSKEISNIVLERTHLEQRMRVALDEGNFRLFYQPIINSKTQEIASLEALIRWEDAELGNVSPGHFIPIAEEVGLINAIGSWVLTDVCRQVREWLDAGAMGLKVAINVSGRQLEKPDFSDQVLNNLKKYNVPPESLYLELTESAVIQGEEGVLATLRKLQKIGVKIALDDFGTGYSSLSYLRHLPIDILKIDRSFIQGLGQQNNNVILSAIITMAHALNLEVVAEGVETQGQFAFLKKEQCNLIQGFLFHRPEPVDKVTEKLIGNKAKSNSSRNGKVVNFPI